MLPLLCLLCLVSIFAALPEPDDATAMRLQSEVNRLAAMSGGIFGVSALHIETGRRISVCGDKGFPMASTCKVPLAIHLLLRVEEGAERLDRMIDLHTSDLHPGSGAISPLFKHPGISLSLLNLLELTMTLSDNSATDVILRESGGPGAVSERLQALNVEGIRLDRPTVELIRDFAGFDLPPESDWTPEVFVKADQEADAQTDETKRKLIKRFVEDPRDTSTPDGMVDLLARLWGKELLSPDSTALLLAIMARCETGVARLRGLLPLETLVMHKTGTLITAIQAVTNDVGIIALPGDAGHVAIAAFVKSSEEPGETQERAIAEVARAVYDYFLLCNG